MRVVSRTTRLFFAALGLIYLIAFVSFGLQVDGLVGSHGILPVADYLRAMHQAMGPRAYWFAPTVFWLNSSDRALHLVWLAGAALSIVLTLGFFRRLCLLLLLLLYLSICTAGQEFWSFQWDILLLETGFLALFLDDTPRRIWLFRWLLFRLMFMSGAVKLLSGDPTWRNLTALSYHYETQPLPTPIAWYMYQLPAWFQQLSTAVTFFAELLVPFAIFVPPRFRRVAAGLLISFQVLILLTGNYTFFNLLAIALCLFLFVDGTPRHIPAATRPHRLVTILVTAFILVTSSLQFVEMFSLPLPTSAQAYLGWISPLRIVNGYGLFAVMTTTRPEIIVQGSQDREHWLTYEFRYKPGDVDRPPRWAEPYQPRLDWQMWFAALGNRRQNPWFYAFAAQLMRGSVPVLRLLARNPFPAGPPRYLRAQVYDYQFTDWKTRKATGAWWRRQLKATYLPPVSLRAASVSEPRP